MNPATQRAKEQNLSGIVRKVLEAIPIQESWEVGPIFNEMRRTGHSTDYRTVHGCIAQLVELGLVSETSRGCFKRITAKPKLVPERENSERVMSMSSESGAAADQGEPKEERLTAPSAVISEQEPPIDRMYAALSELESSLAIMADASKLASQAMRKLEETALELEAASDKLQAKLETLERFRALLKDL